MRTGPGCRGRAYGVLSYRLGCPCLTASGWSAFHDGLLNWKKLRWQQGTPGITGDPSSPHKLTIITLAIHTSEGASPCHLTNTTRT